MARLYGYPYEPAKHKVPFGIYAPIVLLLGLLWIWQEKGNPSVVTIILSSLGLIHLGKGIGRFIVSEMDTQRQLREMKGIK